MKSTNKVEIYDTTLRDGTQAHGVSLSVADKLLIAETLDSLGVDYIEGGYPLSNPKDASFFIEVTKRNWKHAKVAAFGMTRRKGISANEDAGMKALVESNAPVVTIVGKSWDLHVRDVLRVSEPENVDMIADSVAFVHQAGREVIYDAEHFFDGWYANRDYAIETLRAARDAGATCLVLCDTNGGRTMEQIAEVCDDVAREMGSDVKIGIHCHNDCGLAVANSLTGVCHGVTHVQGTINGIGERCGNTDLTAIIPNLVLKYGRDVLTPTTLPKLTEASRYVYEVANLNFQDNQPFVGASAFAHKGGMHVHAVQRNSATYEHIDPAKVGNIRRILVSELSGMSNIAATAPSMFKIADDKQAQRKVLNELMRLENLGYQFEAAEASFELLIRRTLAGDWYRKLWDLDHYRCMILRRNGRQANTEATVKIVLDGKVMHTVAEGDGPVDSLRQALSAALREQYPCVDDLHLADYKVRVINTSADTAATVRVVIDWNDSRTGSYFGSVGVSSNIIDASWLALLDAFEYKVLNSVGPDGHGKNK